MKKYNKIVINGRFLTQKLTGVQRYALEITKALDELIENSNIIFELLLPADTEDANIPLLKNISVIKFGSKSGIKWEQLELSKYLKKEKALGLHLCNSVPLFNPKGICCVHDITYKINPQFITTKHLALAKIWHLLQYKIAITNSLQLFTVSEYSKQEIINNYKIDPKKVSVAYNGWQHFDTNLNPSSTLEKFPQLKDKEFYFSLATMAKNKNFPWIVQAAKKNPNSVFAVAGNLNIEQLGNNLGTDIPKNLLTLGYISDDDAKLLMNRCKAFLFPSFYEGFGIPPLEAMAMGAEVICSNAACLPEVFMDCVHYIDPYKESPDLDNLLQQEISPASKVLDKYNWKYSAEKYMDFIKLIIN